MDNVINAIIKMIAYCYETIGELGARHKYPQEISYLANVADRMEKFIEVLRKKETTDDVPRS